jgi:hypothetical protein
MQNQQSSNAIRASEYVETTTKAILGNAEIEGDERYSNANGRFC